MFSVAVYFYSLLLLLFALIRLVNISHNLYTYKTILNSKPSNKMKTYVPTPYSKFDGMICSLEALYSKKVQHISCEKKNFAHSVCESLIIIMQIIHNLSRHIFFLKISCISRIVCVNI